MNKWLVRLAWGWIARQIFSPAFRLEIVSRINGIVDIPNMDEDREQQLILIIYDACARYLK